MRDAFGIKPIYYFNKNENIYISSEIQPILLLLDNKINENIQSVYNYLTWGVYDNNTETFFEDIYQLNQSHFLEIDTNNQKILKKERWWYPSIDENKEITFKKAIEQFKELFFKNISEQMRSDVPVGLTLSGGLDSSSIACSIRYLFPKIDIRTYSYISSDQTTNEEK